MKKFFLTVIFCTVAILQTMASQANIYVNKFKYESGVTQAVCDQIRNSVISGIQSANRVTLIDGVSSDLLNNIQNRETSEAALSDATARASIVQLGIDYILDGTVTSQNITSSTDKNGKVTYKAKVCYTLKLYSVTNGTLVNSLDYEETESNSDRNEAINSCKASSSDMNKLIQLWFPLRAKIVATDYEIDLKKNEMSTCYIELGTDHNVQTGQFMDVFIVNIVAGRETQKMIGSLKVTEILAGDLSKCKVTKGGDAILKAMKEYETMLNEDPDNAKPLTIKTRPTKTVLDKLPF